MPKVSVIMGVYNCKNFDLLHKSINSIINQSFLDFEFIICDDGSDNDTLNYLNTIKSSDKRIKVISYPKNIGLSNALNVCINASCGKYIARQDDDDISHVDRLKKEVEFLEKNSAYSMVGTLADIYDDSGVWGKYNLPEYPRKIHFLWNSPFIHPTIMIRKSVLIDLSYYRVANETRRCEDIDLFMRMYGKGYIGYNLQEILYSYRIDSKAKNKHRPFKYRIDESIVKFKGYKSMRILLIGFPFIFKPILVGLIPQNLFIKIKRYFYNRM